jgi:hypothetical protein
MLLIFIGLVLGFVLLRALRSLISSYIEWRLKRRISYCKQELARLGSPIPEGIFAKADETGEWIPDPKTFGYAMMSYPKDPYGVMPWNSGIKIYNKDTGSDPASE